jgi:Macrocin-O-methyltransferase (TylF)
LQSDLTQGQMEIVLGMLNEIERVPGDIVEIGSWKCGTSGVMAARRPEKQVYAFDLFGGMPYGMTDGPFEYFAHTDWEEIQRTASHFPNLHLVRGPHEETVPKFEHRPLSLIFMDSDFYSSHKVSLTHLCPMLVQGGFIMFHDWFFREVQQAACECMKESEWGMFEAEQMHGMAILGKNSRAAKTQV